ncbi:hypothetical protein N2152v2_011174 [Parachlorella kessleri]
MGCTTSKPAPAVQEETRKKSAPAPAPAGAPTRHNGGNPGNTVLGKGLNDVNLEYTLGKVLGRGQFGTTRLAEKKAGGGTFACKSIAKRKLQCVEDVEDVRREVAIMHHLKGHPNITYLQGAYEDRQSVHLVMDLCSGGELFDRIVAKGQYSEKDAAALIRTMVSVVAHCHSLGVMHRDLKPENFLLDSKKENATIKCTDFGLSVFFKPGQYQSEVVGSAYYVAPEVLRKKYGPEADIWSCGIILYILLSGVPPFWGETEKEIFNSILKGELDFDSDPWPKISWEAKSCLKKMLESDPRKRATADQILQHPWMRENGVASDKPLDNVILKRMGNFAKMNRMKKEAMKVIAAGMPAEEIAGLEAIFKSIDVDGSGTITAEELREALQSKGSRLRQEDLEALMKMVDVDASGTIDYEEFLAATLSQHQLMKEENMMRAFQHFDKDGSGTISREELREALKAGGTSVDEEIDAIIAEIDKDGNGEIDYQEFVDMMLKQNEQLMETVAQQKRGLRGGLNSYKAMHAYNY